MVHRPDRVAASAARGVGGRQPVSAGPPGERQAALAVVGGAVAPSLRSEIAEVHTVGIAFDRDEHTVGSSAAGIAGRVTGGFPLVAPLQPAGAHVVAISAPAQTELFRAHEKRVVAALRQAAKSPVWGR